MVRVRLRILMALFSLAFAVILGRLAWVQIVDGASYRKVADEMGRSLHLQEPRRGRILAAGGEALADNQIRYDLVYTLDGLHPRERIFARLQTILGICDVPAHFRKHALCTCRKLENHLFERFGDPLAVELALLKGDASVATPQLFVDAIAPSAFRKLSSHSQARLADNGITFVHDLSSRTYAMWVEPERLLRMELTLLRLARLCELPYGFADPELTHTLRGRVAAAAAEVDERHGGEDDVTRQKLLTMRNALRVKDRVLVENVSKTVVTEVIYHPERYRGVRVERRHERVYPMAAAAGMLSGHLRTATGRDLERWRDAGTLIDLREASPGYFLDSFPERRKRGRFAEELFGARGLERFYDDVLRGRYGVQLVLRDARDRRLSMQPFDPIEPLHGEDVRTTLDATLQKTVHDSLDALCGDYGSASAGSAVVMALDRSVLDGEFEAFQPGALTAMACSPTFDPNRIREADYYEQVKDTHLYPRPLYPPRYPPPGSVFKLFVAIAALESGETRSDGVWTARPLDPAETWNCQRYFDPDNPRFFQCTSRHGPIDLERALMASCNCYFYWLARDRLRSQTLFSWALNFGFGRGVGLDIGRMGRLDRDRGPEKLLRRDVRRNEMPNYGIGHAHVEASPLHVLRAVAAIALDGRAVPWPYLVTPQVPEPLRLSNPRTIPVVQRGMRRAVSEDGGTAANARLGLSRFSVAAKTGTAQGSGTTSVYYSWIAGYAPAERPAIAFAICIEDTPQHGGDATAPVLRAILEHYATRFPERFGRQHGGPQ